LLIHGKRISGHYLHPGLDSGGESWYWPMEGGIATHRQISVVDEYSRQIIVGLPGNMIPTVAKQHC